MYSWARRSNFADFGLRVHAALNGVEKKMDYYSILGLYMGIMENRMETTITGLYRIQDLGFRVWGLGRPKRG